MNSAADQTGTKLEIPFATFKWPLLTKTFTNVNFPESTEPELEKIIQRFVLQCLENRLAK